MAYRVVGIMKNGDSKTFTTMDLEWAAKAYAQDILQQPLGLLYCLIWSTDDPTTMKRIDKE